MNINAEIICRRNEGYGIVCDWKGPRNGVAKLYRESFWDESGRFAKQIERKVYEVGRLRLRVIQFPYFVEAGTYADCAAVMLESPHAQLYQLYREKAEAFVRLVMRFEAAYYAFCFKLRQGQEMPLTKKLADLLL